MNDDSSVFFLGILFGALIGILFGVVIANSAWKSELVDYGLAQYCPDTGYWAWVGGCEQ